MMPMAIKTMDVIGKAKGLSGNGSITKRDNVRLPGYAGTSAVNSSCTTPEKNDVGLGNASEFTLREGGTRDESMLPPCASAQEGCKKANDTCSVGLKEPYWVAFWVAVLEDDTGGAKLLGSFYSSIEGARCEKVTVLEQKHKRLVRTY